MGSGGNGSSATGSSSLEIPALTEYRTWASEDDLDGTGREVNTNAKQLVRLLASNAAQVALTRLIHK